ncbi:IclR family transcriptional regulator [Nocardia spumae]|uniref:IclR family transcriptional regulator n=1 Tax=Nocardia spumae TaxID=2887190 RepID=UPI001D14FA03|nr:IclR family transcriptional regulator [Nocardia spumae]
MTLILDMFEHRSTRLSLVEICNHSGLPRSTAHRILEQLVKLHWLEHTPSGYCLGRRSLGLGGYDGQHGEIREAAADYLHDLQLRTGMVVHLAALEGADEIYLDKLGGPFARTLESRVGFRSLAHHTTGGRAMLAWLPPEEVESLLARRLANPATARGWDLAGLYRELNRIRQNRGLSFDRGEWTNIMVGRMLPSVATAIRGPQGPVAAICLCGETNFATMERLAPLVADAATRTARVLFPEAARRHGVPGQRGTLARPIASSPRSA